MLEQEIRKQIFKKLEAMNESIDYEFKTLVELQSDIQTIYFLLYILEKNETKESNNG